MAGSLATFSLLLCLFWDAFNNSSNLQQKKPFQINRNDLISTSKYDPELKLSEKVWILFFKSQNDKKM